MEKTILIELNMLELNAFIRLRKNYVVLKLFLELHNPLNGRRSMALGWDVLGSSSSCPTSDALRLYHHLDSLTCIPLG